VIRGILYMKNCINTFMQVSTCIIFYWFIDFYLREREVQNFNGMTLDIFNNTPWA
jgi:hypothetical protein